MTKLFVTLIFLALALDSISQELPRRGFIGIRMENLTDDMRSLMGLVNTKGVLISEVIPKSTAEEAGFKRGDILVSLNKKGVASSSEVLEALVGFKGGDKFEYQLLREKKAVNGEATFKAFPVEQYNGLVVEYSQAKTLTGLQRMIITRPISANGKLPVVAFIGGIGCYSLDFALDTSRSEVQLLNKLSREGFMCVRLEKPGMGDNARTSKACGEIGFNEEVTHYAQAIKQLKQRPDVDSSAVYIFGHSMGGVMAPLIAQQTNLKGIMAYGTIGSNFMEYLLKTRRTIGEAYDWEPEETDAYIKDVCECAAFYFAEKMTTEEAATRKPDCREYLEIFDLRARRYNDELYALNIPAAWKLFSGKALIIYGESDYVASRQDHEILVSAINRYHPNNAKLAIVKSADHGMNLAASFQEARTNPGGYNPEIGKTVFAWLHKIQS